jgi:hypothetical protein
MRAGLRRLMPGVAAAAALLVLLQALAGGSAPSGSVLRAVLDLATFLSVVLALIYYVPKALSRLGVLLLWRVRRRLVITYLFVGLTPILLLALLGLIAGFGVSAEAMARVVSGQVHSAIRQAEASARTLASDLSRHLERADERQARAWLEERSAVLQASLPGARLVVWCCGSEGTGETPADLTAGPAAQSARRAVAGARSPGGAGKPARPLLPAWLRDRPEWSGLAYEAPPGAGEEGGGAFAVRALARGRAAGRGPFTVLLEVPVSEGFLARLRDTTDIEVHPLRQEIALRSGGEELSIGDEEDAGEDDLHPSAAHQPEAAESAAPGPEQGGPPGPRASTAGGPKGTTSTAAEGAEWTLTGCRILW